MKKGSSQVALLAMLAMTLVFFAPGLLAKGSAEAGAEKLKSLSSAANNCKTCHAEDGNSVIPANPKLAGQHASYLYKQLKDFKSGKRKGVMNAMVKGLSDQDMQNLAAYFASKKIKIGTAKKDLVKVGRKLYEGGNPKTKVPACMGCHGPAGTGNAPARFPALGGQHAAYTAAQLKGFRKAAREWVKNAEAGKDQPKQLPGRANDVDRMMQHVVLYMSDAEIEAVASYLQGLHPKVAAKNTAQK